VTRGFAAHRRSPLAIHGDADGIVPSAGSGKRTREAIGQRRLALIAGGPHGITGAMPIASNTALLGRLGESYQFPQQCGKAL